MPRTIKKLSMAAAVITSLSASLFIGSEAQAQTVVFGVAPPAVSVQIRLAPPPLPVYVQPPCPVVGYMWTPGYWAYGPDGYYWVPGTWVEPPEVGVLWTPGYWGWVDGIYSWHAGYWGPHVGFYGGVNYGFGYGGVGFAGGRWEGGRFAYNAAVTNVNVNIIHNTYRESVVNNVTVNRVSFNGGPGGLASRPTPQERMAEQEHHFAPTGMQRQHVQEAQHNPELSARANGGHPGIAATARPAVFNGPGVERARGAAPMNHEAGGGNRPGFNGHAGQGPQGMQRDQAGQHQQVQHQQAEHQQMQRQQSERQQAQRPEGERQQFERQQQERPQQHEQPQRPEPQQHAQQSRPQQEHREAPREHEEHH